MKNRYELKYAKKGENFKVMMMNGSCHPVQVFLT